MKIDKNNEQTNFNLGTLFVLEGNQIISEMNNLGMSKKDDRRYKHLKKRKNKLIKFAVSYFEKVLQKNKNNEDAINALLIINNNPGYK